MNFRSDFRSNLNRSVLQKFSGLGEEVEAIKNLRKVLDATEKTSAPSPEFSQSEFDDIERLLAGIAAGLRIKHFTKSNVFKLREIKNAERLMLEKAGTQLGLQMRWLDHTSAADTDSGFLIVAEPYGLRVADMEEIATLSKAGWSISVDERFATYFPGRACCILLKPPTES